MDYIEKFVSVVIPTHNRANLICRAINSALNQTYKKIEVIVVSDGSDDGTDEIMKKYESQYSNLRYISYFPGKGGNHARNIGIVNSKGEYIAFLDDDDEWHEDKIQLQMNVIEQNSDIGLVCTAINSIDDDTKKQTIFTPSAPQDCSKEILKYNLIGSTTTVLTKHELLDLVKMFDENLEAMQDYDLWIRLCQVTKVGIVQIPCVEYHNLKSNSQISWNYEKYLNASQYIYQKYQYLRESKLTSKEIKKIRMNDNLIVARKAFKTNNRKIVRKYAKEAFKYSPNFKSLVYCIASFLPFNLVNKVYSYFI
ncbi:glycosyltransferase family 2 protein [Eubacterium sp. MSJ-33]|uniref:glycosyltransferase family 2 protein n=1 Tax=Eubacterium sp. MSJ-33 TaxID=2841528 RepID=UPI001C764B98|nr:glycosyltransferase family 2 protein [Eubacterium sp. MSJ-33]QWT52214.1 glycosyltransferase [Eubacterium sp. MSJ-33]